MHAGGRSHALEFAVQSFSWVRPSPSAFTFAAVFLFDLASCLVVSGHTSTQTCAQGRATCVCAASNSVDLRFGFVRLQVKRLIFLILLDHRNLSLHDLGHFHLFQELRLVNLRGSFILHGWSICITSVPLCQSIESVFFNTTGTLTILLMNLQCVLYLFGSLAPVVVTTGTSSVRSKN